MTQKVKKRPLRGFLTYSSDYQTLLFEFDFCANFFELSLEGFSVSLSEAFLNHAGSAVYEFFSFLESKTGELFNELNDFEFFAASVLENYVERRFFFSSSASSGGACCNGYSSSCGLDAVLFFENLSEFVYFLNGEVYELFSKSI